MASRIVVITGTDTGVGKTLMTALLLRHLRRAGERALAMKPFCCGGRQDVELLGSLQDNELTQEEINPHYFSEPLAPLVAARKEHRRIRLEPIVKRIREMSRRCDWLLVEGAGGLLTPLGEGFHLGHMIGELRCDAVVVSSNRLGTINHTRLTVGTLEAFTNKGVVTVLMEQPKRDLSAESNLRMLAELLGGSRVFGLEYLGKSALEEGAIKKSALRVKKTLARILA